VNSMQAPHLASWYECERAPRCDMSRLRILLLTALPSRVPRSNNQHKNKIGDVGAMELWFGGGGRRLSSESMRVASLEVRGTAALTRAAVCCRISTVDETLRLRFVRMCYNLHPQPV